MSSSFDRYLCFKVAQEEFAIPLLTVKQVIGMPEVTTVPQVPSYFLGIMNLRGQVISIIDLRLKLGIKTQEQGAEKSVIIIEMDSHSIGLVVDEVHSVLSAIAENLSPPPDLGRSPAGEYVSAVYRKDDKLILIIDILKILSVDDRATALRAVA
ncbi:MAG: chemotaxis protein CheW [Bdellovibrio sp.]|nr:MAG: chemotaxis protein CheW [Bdellovibrio sp.]